MDYKTRNEKFKKFIDKKSPKTRALPSLFWAFVIGGGICMIGQGISDGLDALFSLSRANLANWTLIVIIFITVLLTGIGVWDRIGYLGGAGAFIPITGFANAVASPAIEFKKEGLVFGLAVKMFAVAGPIIVFGVVSSAIVGILHLIF